MICSRRGGLDSDKTSAVVTLDTAVDESRKKSADSVTRLRDPARLYSRDGKLCYHGRLEYDFLAFLTCFLLFLCYHSLSPCASLLRLPSSVQHSSAALQQELIPGSACSCVIFVSCLMSEFLLFYLFSIFRSSYVLVGVFVVLSCPFR